MVMNINTAGLAEGLGLAAALGGSAAGYAASLRAMGTGTQEPLWERLAEIRARVLLVAGARDVKYCAIARAMAAALRDARVAIVHGAGHAVLVGAADDARDLVEVVDRWGRRDEPLERVPFPRVRPRQRHATSTIP